MSKRTNTVRWTRETHCTTKECTHVFQRHAVLYGKNAFSRCPKCGAYVDTPFEKVKVEHGITFTGVVTCIQGAGTTDEITISFKGVKTGDEIHSNIPANAVTPKMGDPAMVTVHFVRE